MATFESETLRLSSEQNDHLQSITNLLSTTRVDTGIRKFEGVPAEFKGWIKNIEKYNYILKGNKTTPILLAYQSSDGIVSDFILRHTRAAPKSTWEELKAELQAHFGAVIDAQHALHLLRRTRQKHGESVQVFAEKLISLSEDAFPGVEFGAAPIQSQLIDIFVDGLEDAAIARKVIRDNPQDFNTAVKSAAAEQNLNLKFALRHRGPDKKPKQPMHLEPRGEPMEVDKTARQCSKCGREGHLAINCRARAQVQAVQKIDNPPWPAPRQGQWRSGTGPPQDKHRRSHPVKCWACGKQGHIQWDCPTKSQANAWRGQRSGPRQQQPLN